jgi:signal transduction histidine kinase
MLGNLGMESQHVLRDYLSAAFFLLGSIIFCVIASLLLEHGRRSLYGARAELLQRNSALEIAQSQQRELLRTITHELRTPINSVLGFIELIEVQDPGLAATTRTRLARMTAASRRLLAVINDILDLSKLEAGKLVLAFEDCAVHDMLAEVAEEVRALIKSRPVQVRVNCAEGLRFCADPLRLRQIITNLAGNAAKFTPEGLIELSAQLDSPQQLHIAIVDSGVGIREEDKARLLEPFAQAKEGRVAGGTGLGLSISKRLVERMGGAITFESQFGHGTAFDVRIPRPPFPAEDAP